jgi:predicted N-acetyltransferase YhbS
MSITNNIHIRREQPSDHHAVEALTRDAFWINTDRHTNIDEHLLVHKLRSVSVFIPELDYIAEADGAIVGNVMYSKAKIIAPDTREHEVLTFGPLSVLPEYQKRGVGVALIRFTIAEARRMGYRAIVFFGAPDYYPRLGFRRGAEFGLTDINGNTYDALMAMELFEGALNGIRGRFIEDGVFHDLPEAEVDAFDQNFPPKQPREKIKIDVLLERLDPLARQALQSCGLTLLGELYAFSEQEISAVGVDDEARNVIRAVMKEYGRVWGA